MHSPRGTDTLEEANGTNPPSPHRDKEWRGRLPSSSAHTKPKNAGAPVTRAQQWRILSSACLMAFTVIGCTQSFGVFQTHYGRIRAVQEGVLRPEDLLQRPLISTIGSLGNGGLVATFGVLYYPHMPKLGGQIKWVCMIGATLIAVGFATATTSHNLETLVGCQGVLVGFGSGDLVYILTPILPEYFPERSGLAQGVMFASASLGGMTWSLVLTELLETIGIRWTLGFLSIFSGVVLCIASTLALPPRKFETRCTSMVSWKVLLDPMFLSLAVVNLAHPLTLAIPMVFGPEFAESVGASVTQGSFLLAINSGVGIPGRLCTGWLADKIGHLNMLLIATSVYALATWAFWLPAAITSNMPLYICMSVCHGLVNGVFNTVMNSTQKMLFGAEMYYPKAGATTSIRGVAYVIGVPIAGALVSAVTDEDLQGNDFTKPIVYTGACLTLSLLCLVNVRRLDAKRDGWNMVR